MNNVNFLGQDQFPWSSDTFDFLQKMILQSATLAQLGGDTYILSGCVENGLNVGDGIIVINGEVMPFKGGPKQTTIYIQETRRDVNASGYVFSQVYRDRYAAFGLGEPQYNWADIKRVDTNLQLRTAIDGLKSAIDALQGIPAGIVTMWSGSVDKVPAGWALCDGLQGRPNLSGMFVVGFNVNDADYNAIGKTGGAKTVTLESDQQGTFTVQVRADDGDNNRSPEYRAMYEEMRFNGKQLNKQWDTWGQSMEVSLSKAKKPVDNRPPYYVLAYIIKL
ncbi:MAG: hypothetical protein E6767_20370 [Dysgonomonas sp.]|nr:hypothetical protein [Dysgonomonas sp.]